MIDLSFIIPVYNSEKHIERCIESVISAHEKSDLTIEIIIVNDGSTDRSLAVINRIVQNNKNHQIHIYSQVNQGVYKARNFALSKVKGNSIWMIDSDDFINSNSLRIIQKTLKNKDFDIISFEYMQNSYNSDFINKKNLSNISSNSITGETYLKKNDGRLYLWTNIYRTHFLYENNIKFLAKATSLEDSLFNLHAFINALKVIIIKEPFYYYCENSESISRNHSIDNLLKLSKNTQIVHHGILDLLSNLDNTKSKIVKSKLSHSVLGYFFSLMMQKYPINHIKSTINLYQSFNLYPIKKSINTNIKSKLFRIVVNNKFIFLNLCKFFYSRNHNK